jgi:hypothetical protein
VIGASISAVIAVFVVLLTAYLERRRKSHSDSADRLAEYLASTHDGEVAISDLARAADGDKNKAREDVRLRMDRKNTVLEAIKLLEKDEIVVAANKLDERLQDLFAKAKEKEYKDEWPAERRDLEEAVAEFIKVSREELRPRADRKAAS